MKYVSTSINIIKIYKKYRSWISTKIKIKDVKASLKTRNISLSGIIYHVIFASTENEIAQ